jgi:hypothetical protein
MPTRDEVDYWYVTGLRGGPIAWASSPDQRSTGRQIQIERAVVYGAAAR